ncbi:MAG: peptidylprolyl isomerase [Devosia sp.]|nr:peptidylprolyl isomerase [Devosia sp.]
MTRFAPLAGRFTLKSFAVGLLLASTLGLAPLSGAAAQETAPAQSTPDAVVAIVGGQSITEADLAFAAEDLQQELGQVPPADRRAFLVTVLIDMKVMAQAAKAAGMNETEMFKRRLAYLEERALRRAYFAEKIAAAVTDEAIRAAYDEFVAGFQSSEEIRARHILVATREEADAVAADLAAGKTFEIVAMEKTTDPSGKQNGGDLGFFGKGQMVPEFEAVAFALEPGQVSEPVQSQFGWHVIKLEERRMSPPPSLEQMTPQLGQQVMYEAFDASVLSLKAGMAIDIPDAALAEGVKRQSEPAGQ